jgi:hypothetical protein
MNWLITAKEKLNPQAQPMKLRMSDGPETQSAATALFKRSNPRLELVKIEAEKSAAPAAAPETNA